MQVLQNPVPSFYHNFMKLGYMIAIVILGNFIQAEGKDYAQNKKYIYFNGSHFEAESTEWLQGERDEDCINISYPCAVSSPHMSGPEASILARGSTPNKLAAFSNGFNIAMCGWPTQKWRRARRD